MIKIKITYKHILEVKNRLQQRKIEMSLLKNLQNRILGTESRNIEL